MAQLYFRYSTMNAGKSAEILKIAHNYEEQNKRVMLFSPSIDDRYGTGNITSRLGLSREAHIIDGSSAVYEMVESEQPDCILVDEGQFLSRANVLELTRVVDVLNIPVIVYGLKNDYRNQLFPGSEALLLLADKIEEIKAVCWYCTKKATMLIKFQDGVPVNEGEQVEIGGNDKYVSVCRKCYSRHVRLK